MLTVGSPSPRKRVASHAELQVTFAGQTECPVYFVKAAESPGSQDGLVWIRRQKGKAITLTIRQIIIKMKE